MIDRIEVWISLLDNQVPAGEMVSEIGEDGRGRGAFRYAPDYLDRPDAFALDPVSLPLREGEFNVVHPGVFGVFEDSLPDDWGRRLSPSFDLVPDIGQRGEHVLFFDLDPTYPGRSNLEKLGRTWGISGAEEVVEQVFTSVAGWRDEFMACGVQQKDIDQFAEIDAYLNR